MAVFLHIIAPLFGVSYYSGIFCSVFFPRGCAPRDVVFESEWRECRGASAKSPLISVEWVCVHEGGGAHKTAIKKDGTAQCRQTAAGHKHWWIAAWVFKSRYFNKNTQSIVRNIQQPFSLIPERMTLTSRLLYSVAWLVLLFERKNRLNRFFWMNQNQTSRSMIATNIRFPNEWL